jgi:hypothetical protein
MHITDAKWINSKGEIKYGFYMDEYLAINLMGIPSYLKKAWDVVGVISGHGLVRVGKTLLGSSKIKLYENGKLINSKPLRDYKDKEVLNTCSFDFNERKIVPSKSEVIIEKDLKDFYEIELVDGKKITCTLDHRLFVKRNNKVMELALRDIKEGDELICTNI